MEQTDIPYLKPGDKVGLRWGEGIATGIVVSIHAEPAEIMSKGSLIVR